MSGLQDEPTPLVSLHDGVRGFVSARLVCLFLCLIATLAWDLISARPSVSSISFLYFPLIAGVVVSGLSLAWLRHHRASFYFAIFQIAIDAAVVTLAIYVTGDATSPLLFIYLPFVMAVSVMLSRGLGLVATAISTALFVGLIFLMASGRLAPADGESIVRFVLAESVLKVIGLASAMLLTSVLASFLTFKLNQKYQAIEASHATLSAMSRRQQVMVEGISSGLISVDISGAIVSATKQALDLLRLRERDAVGKDLGGLLRSIDDAFSPDDLLKSCERKREFSVSDSESGEDLRLTFVGKPVLDGQAKVTGYVFVFEDITKLRSMENQLEVQERMARLLAQQDRPAEGGARSRLSTFVGESAVMQKVFNLIERVAASDATVLVCGESGTGKELVARAIHSASNRSQKPFIALNCGAIPENLLESELFGHRKGSFTGADSDHPGLFRQAEGGTLFLDEIGELPLQLQAKLLRAIQEKAVRAIGGERDTPINVRILAATNRNLRKCIASGTFREDLYYRLNVITLNLPPLRDRREDIPLLVNSILKRIVAQGVTPVVPPATLQLLMNYGYQGNVRELENILERAYVLGGEVVLPEHLPENVRAPSPQESGRGATEIIVDDTVELPMQLDELLGRIERRYLEVALVRTNGAKKKAAGLLGMNFRSFRYRLQKFGIHDEGEE